MIFRLSHIIKKELIQTLRDKRAFTLLLIAPLIQLLIFGYVATTDIKKTPMVICDYDNTSSSREFIEKFTASGYFDNKYYTRSSELFNYRLDASQAVVGITIPAGFSETLKKGRQASVGIVLDGTNSNLATILSGYINFTTADYSRQISNNFIKSKGLSLSNGIDVQPRVWFNPDLKSVNFMVPGVMGMLILILLLNLTSLSIVRERELGTAEQLVVTPIKPIELVIGKIIPACLTGYLVITLVLVTGLIWFKINFAGSVFLLYFLAAFFMFCAISMGLLISTYSQTGDQAMWANQFLMMPNVLLSGFIFPIDNMPDVVQYLTYILPMRYFLRIIRGIFLQGAGFTDLWHQALILLIWAVIVTLLAALRLRKHLV
ncbi:MAG: ABC transporter permease [Candidatus Zixiibacteriota bacterium]|nr:MAG: ABC transporter permease [candidate division Zixibacteria bacterium]